MSPSESQEPVEPVDAFADDVVADDALADEFTADDAFTDALTSDSSAVVRRLDLDPRIAQVLELVGQLQDDVVTSRAGALGVSATGLMGNVDDNLLVLAEITTALPALLTVAAAKADRADETWRGLRAVLRHSAKVSEPEIATAAKAAAAIGEHPQLIEPWVRGAISAVQVRDIGELAARVPLEHRDAAVMLLADRAPGLTVRELRRVGRVLLNTVVPGWEERDGDRDEANTHLSIYPDRGGYSISGWLPNESAGWLRTVLEAHTSVVASGDTRSFGERQAEALVTVCRQYASSSVIPKLAMARPVFVVLATLDDLRSIAIDEAPGDFPVSLFGDTLDPVTVRRMLSDADFVPVLEDPERPETLADVALDAASAERVRAMSQLFKRRRRSRIMRTSSSDEVAAAPALPVLMRLLTTPVRTLAMGQKVRTVPPYLRNAVSLRDQHCVVDGCDVPALRCEVHHVVPWAANGPTDLDNLALLCVRHHRRVERGDWELRPRRSDDGAGRYWIAVRRGG